MRPTKDSVIIILSIITLFALVAGGYFYLQDENLKKLPVDLTEFPTPTSTFYPTMEISDTETTTSTATPTEIIN